MNGSIPNVKQQGRQLVNPATLPALPAEALETDERGKTRINREVFVKWEYDFRTALVEQLRELQN